MAGDFYPAGLYDQAFPTTLPGEPAFSRSFDALNFNANQSVLSCNPASGVSEYTRPLTDVIPQADGSCVVEVAQGNGYQAGVGSLEAFDAAFTSTISVSAPGDVTFGFTADDGWILGIGPDASGAQPAYGGGLLSNAPLLTAALGLPVVGADNNPRPYSYSENVVSFPEAGTYAVELDYFEVYGGPLAMTLTANGQPIAVGVPSSATCTPGASTSATNVTIGDVVDCTFSPGTAATFGGWATSGFTPSASSSPAASFTASGIGPASITAQWSDGTGSHQATFLYGVNSAPSSLTCSPGSTNSTTAIAYRSTVSCQFSLGAGAEFDGWEADAFTQLTSGLSPSFLATGGGVGLIAARWTDSFGDHESRFLYGIIGGGNGPMTRGFPYVSQFGKQTGLSPQQSNVACGPASTTMVLRHWLGSHNSPKLADIYTQMGTTYPGASIFDVQAELARKGQAWNLSAEIAVDNADPSSAAYWQSDALARLARLEPLIALIPDTAGLPGYGAGGATPVVGHFIVLTGYDAAAGMIVYQDPAIGANEEVSVDTLATVWGRPATLQWTDSSGVAHTLVLNPFQFVWSRPN